MAEKTGLLASNDSPRVMKSRTGAIDKGGETLSARPETAVHQSKTDEPERRVSHLRRLVHGGELVIKRPKAANPPLQILALAADEIVNGSASPERVLAGIVSVLDAEDFAQDLQVMGDVEGVSGVLVAEEVVEVVEPGPGDRRQA